MREDVYNKSQLFQERVKKFFDKGTKTDDFQIHDLVLKWDARNEYKGKHRKFDHRRKGNYIIVAYQGNNAFILQELNGDPIGGGLVNGEFLKHYFTQRTDFNQDISL